MKTVVELRDRRQADFEEHPFFAWLRSDRVPLERRLDFSTMAALFVMQFRDMNQWVLQFPKPHNEFEWVITRGTIEDATHSGLFLEDWRTLGLDERLGWRASDMLWWLFLSEDQEPYRRIGMKYISMGVRDEGDPLVRFGHSEASEATGHVMLSTSAPVAAQLSARTGEPYRYWGPHHLERESGHVANTEGIFEGSVLTDGQRSVAVELCSEMFGLFEDVFDGFLTYAQRYVENGTAPSRPERFVRADRGMPEPFDLSARQADARDLRVWRVLEQRRRRATQHPFYTWLTDVPAAADARLCAFIPMWTMDVLGYRDLAKYAFTYAEPKTDAERAINRWAAELTTHSQLFLNDWDALQLDQRLGFAASDTLEFLFLDPDMDVHRQHLIEFAKLAIRHQDPALRWWLMTALESTGETFFARTRPLAEAVEAQTGARLDYLTERHLLSGERDARPTVPPTALQPEDEDVAVGLIETVYDALESQLERSYCVARADRFDVLADRPSTVAA